MNCSKFMAGLGIVLVIMFLSGCSVVVNTPQPVPMQPGQSQPNQPAQPGPGQPGPGQPGPGQPPQPVGPGSNDGAPDISQMVLAEQMVTVSGGGGSAEVRFSAFPGQRIQISLTASNPSIQPYGSLQFPDGSSLYNPPLDTAANGANQIEMTVNQDGEYTLTVFDGSNQGGAISVKIVGLPSP